MAEIVRFTEAIDLELVARERTPKPLMELGIGLHLAGFYFRILSPNLPCSVSNEHRRPSTTWFGRPGLTRLRTKARLTKTVIKLDGDRYWLCSEADPGTNEILLTRFYPARTTKMTGRICRDHDVEDATFLVHGAP